MSKFLNNINEVDSKNDVLVFTHLGLGDILANFAINKSVLLKTTGKVYIPTKPRYLDSIMHLYKEEDRAVIFEVDESNYSSEITSVFNVINNLDLDYLMIGFNAVTEPFHYSQFYTQAGIDYNLCWKLFPTLRSSKHSKELYSDLKLKNKDFIIVVDTNSWATYNLKIDSGLEQVKTFVTDKGTGLFDWIDVVLNAKEIHTVGTSFFHLVDHIKHYNNDTKLYFHNCRKDFDTVGKQHNWIKIDYE